MKLTSYKEDPQHGKEGSWWAIGGAWTLIFVALYVLLFVV